MVNAHDEGTIEATEVVIRSRKANRRTLKGCIVQVERMQQQIRNVGMQYLDAKPEVMRALSLVHDSLDNTKQFLNKVSNML